MPLFTIGQAEASYLVYVLSVASLRAEAIAVEGEECRHVDYQVHLILDAFKQLNFDGLILQV